MEKYHYLPKAAKTKDFVILGSKAGFAALLFAALAIPAVCAIILVIRKNKK